MFGMGLWEILLVVLLILVVMGPEKIPEAAKMIGKGVREVRKMSNLLRDAVDIDLDDPKPRNRNVPSKGGAGFQNDVDEYVMNDSEPEPTERPAEIFAVPMTQRQSTSLTEVALSLPKDPEFHREVYLHIPFEETI